MDATHEAQIRTLQAQLANAERRAWTYRAAIHDAAADLARRDEDLGPGERALLDLADCLLHERD